MTRLRIAYREFSGFEKALAAQTKLYCAERPGVEIETVSLHLEQLYRELFAEEGLRLGKWDLGMVVTDWLAGAVEEGRLENLTPYMKAAPLPEWPQGWARSLVEPLDFNGDVYCIPYHDGPECLIYRSDLFSSAQEQQNFRAAYGYDLAPPQTWQQFEDAARFFTRPEEGLFGTVFACFPDGHNTLYDFALQVWSRGGELQDGAGLPLLMSAEAEAALDFYRRVVRDATLCHPGSTGFDSVQSGDAFLSGSVAMMVNWFGFASQSGCAGGALEGKVALAAIPCSPGLTPASLSVFWTMGIGSGSRNKEAAYDFLRFLARPEMDREVVRHGAVGVRLSTWRDAEVQRMVPAFREIEAISMGARRLPRTSGLPEFAEVVNGVVEAALESDEPSASILQRAQQQSLAKKIRFQ
ncbi:extracellular solute-binding protein [Paracidobacterium acidisoli]|uniref:Extracellular solute-binding protein n=1 Tax=Paracidobacterium acidisoli TaxID=2303751 RepID=A0A372ISY4_9BACT|nr:extracellular solute-binding protein [Paracidobacterium acidisoli]MBT9330831.1 extracellular solute-binding protein [Paracidobacterium acidisoli]